MAEPPTIARKVRFAAWTQVALFRVLALPARFVIEGRARGFGKYRVVGVLKDQRSIVELVAQKVLDTWKDLYEPFVEKFSVVEQVRIIALEGFALGARGFEVKDVTIRKIRTHGAKKWKPGDAEVPFGVREDAEEEGAVAIHYGKEPCVIEFEEIVMQTDKAILFRVEGEEHWIPKSQIDHVDEDSMEVTIPEWIAKDRGFVE